MIIQSELEFPKVFNFLAKNNYIAYDLETTGLNVRKDAVIGVGISNAEEGFYLVHKVWDSASKELKEVLSKEQINKIIKHIEKRNQLIAWNASFDLRFTKNYFGVDLIENLWSEAMLAKHTVDEVRPFALKEVAAKLYGEDAKEEQLLMKESIKANGGSANEFYKADLELMARYCIMDCLLTFRINKHYLSEIKSQGLSKFYFQDEVMPLYKYVTIPMEDKGVPLDLPKMEKAYEEIKVDLELLEQELQAEIAPHLDAFEAWYLDKEFPVSRTPANPFVQALARKFNINAPKTGTGNYSLTAKNIEKLEDNLFKDFITGRVYLPKDLMREVQRSLVQEKYIFNLLSKHHLKKLFFEELGLEPINRTDLGNPQVDEEFLESIREEVPFVSKLIEFNKLTKIKSAYLERFLEAQEDGVFYPSFKQHNTISGRYGSDLQQLPRPLEQGSSTPLIEKYTNQIREFFIAGKGRKIVAADMESLEPHVFAHVSNDDGLKNIFLNGLDFYSEIAIKTEKLYQYSSDKRADNYLGKVAKDKRQRSKAYCLGVPYGMSDYKLQFELNVSQKEAKKLIDDYLGAFPNLKKWMEDSRQFAIKNGYIKSQAGRVRHMPTLKKIMFAHGEDILDSLELWKQYNDNPRKYSQMKYLRKEAINYLNNSVNFQIQSLAASIVNKACIDISKYFIDNKLNANICTQLHDEIVIICDEDISQLVAEKLTYFMENSFKISIPLKAPANIANNFKDAK